jgi:RNA polymerase sigma-70 factor (ECF subfamily)
MDLEHFYKTYERDLDRYIKYWSDQHRDITFEDLKSEVDEKLVKSFHTYSEETRALAWLGTVVKNTFINMYRKIQRSKQVFYETDELSDFEKNSNYSSLDLEYEILGVGQILEKYMDTCSEKKRYLLDARMGDMTFEDISDYFGVNSNTARVRMMIIKEEIASDIVSGLNRLEVQRLASAVPAFKKVILRDPYLRKRVYVR